MHDNINEIAFSLEMNIAPGRGRELEKQKSRPGRRESLKASDFQAFFVLATRFG